jgi:hypothetical protein
MNIGPYAETMITTRKADAKTKPDKEVGFASILIALLLIGPGTCAAIFIGLFTWAYIGPITMVAVIGLAIMTCGYYGTNNSILDRFRYRTSAADRRRIARRLSDTN